MLEFINGTVPKELGLDILVKSGTMIGAVFMLGILFVGKAGSISTK